jgi:hypothetical protein
VRKVIVGPHRTGHTGYDFARRQPFNTRCLHPSHSACILGPRALLDVDGSVGGGCIGHALHYEGMSVADFAI